MVKYFNLLCSTGCSAKRGRNLSEICHLFEVMLCLEPLSRFSCCMCQRLKLYRTVWVCTYFSTYPTAAVCLPRWMAGWSVPEDFYHCWVTLGGIYHFIFFCDSLFYFHSFLPSSLDSRSLSGLVISNNFLMLIEYLNLNGFLCQWLYVGKGCWHGNQVSFPPAVDAVTCL